MILLFALLLAIPAFGKPLCSDQGQGFAVDLRAAAGPIRNQGTLGNDAAFAAADMVGRALFKKGLGPDPALKSQMISGAAVSLRMQAGYRSTNLAKMDVQRGLRAQVEPLIRRSTEELHVLEQRKSLRMDYLEGTAEVRETKARKELVNAKLAEIHSGMVNTSNPEETFELVGKGEPLTKEQTKLFNKLDKLLNKDPEIVALNLAARRKAAELWRYRGILRNSGLSPDSPNHGLDAALDSLLEHSICREAHVSSEDHSHSDPRNYARFNLRNLLDASVGSYLNDPSPENKCAAIQKLAPVFNMSIDRLGEVLDQYEEDDPLQLLVERSCPDPKLTEGQRPTYRVLNVELKGVRPEDDLHKMIKAVDGELDQGLFPGIGYSPLILEYGGDRLTKELSAVGGNRKHSTIVGRGYNCASGEPEYLLRDSMGPEKCTALRNRYISRPEDDKVIDAAIEEHNACTKPCIEFEPSNERQECLENCESQINARHISVHMPPYRCTEDGYFVIRQSDLRKGLTQVVSLN